MREGVPRCVLTRIPFAWGEIMNCDDPMPPGLDKKEEREEEVIQGEMLPHEEEGCPVGTGGEGPGAE